MNFATNKGLSDKQKKVALDFIEHEFLGEKEITKDNLDEVCDEEYIDDDQKEKIKKALKKGQKSVFKDQLAYMTYTVTEDTVDGYTSVISGN